MTSPQHDTKRPVTVVWNPEHLNQLRASGIYKKNW